MRQATLKINSFTRAVRIINNHNLKEKSLQIAFMALGGLFIMYAFFLGQMVLNIVERKNIESESRKISATIGELELSYFSKSSEIDQSISATMGFKETKANFATRKSLGTLTLARNEI